MEKKRTRFHFCYAGGSLRQTVEISEENPRCPWCSLHCNDVTGLILHLRVCHDRCTYIVELDAKRNVDILAAARPLVKQEKRPKKRKYVDSSTPRRRRHRQEQSCAHAHPERVRT